MRIPFDTIWEVNNGTITNRTKIRCSGITAHPRALKNLRGTFGGIDWTMFIGRDLDVETDGDTFVLLGIF